MRRAAAVVIVATGLAACGDNLAPPAADCSGRLPPATGLSLEAAREAHRRAALRQRLRYRDAIEPGHVLRTTAALADQARIELGQVCVQDLAEVGRILFEHTFTFADGLAAGPGAGLDLPPFRRVQAGRAGGPETTGCTSCHWRNGPGGGGAVTDASFLLGDGDRVSSADARNPPSLLGAGVAQALAEEMTAELAALRADGLARARRAGARVEVELVAKGVSFGVLRIDPSGRLDTNDVRGIDADSGGAPVRVEGDLADDRRVHRRGRRGPPGDPGRGPRGARRDGGRSPRARWWPARGSGRGRRRRRADGRPAHRARGLRRVARASRS